MNTFLRSSDFDEWLSHLADQKAKARILARLRSAALGNFGDSEPIGEGVSEMRVHVGAGYRVYYTRTGSTVYVLLAGGTKGSPGLASFSHCDPGLDLAPKEYNPSEMLTQFARLFEGRVPRPGRGPSSAIWRRSLSFETATSF